ncbi:MAG: protease pro-enzyme activation domain-containing protein [Verrucomicrobiia bacterium]
MAPAQTSQRTLLPGHRPTVVPSLQPLGRLDGSTRLKLSINLPLHNQEALTNLLDQLYDPASPLYHHYLTPEEFDARFGPTEQDYQAVIAWADRSGFTVNTRHPNRMLLEVSASVADIERALQVTLRTYAHPTESRTFFAPDTEPSAGTGVPILYIGGLDNFARPHPKNLRRSPLQASAKPAPQIIGSGPNGNLAGFDYRAAYAPGVSLTGTGQMVGLVEFDGYYANDIASYVTQTGVSNVPLQVVLLDGFKGVPTTGVNSGNGEVALDIEMAISMAPGLSNVVVFEAGPNGLPNDVLQAMSSSTYTNIKQFSCSWDFGSITLAQRTNMDNYFQKFATQGQSFFDASGDSGAATNAFSAPDDDPYITLVGGTALATAGPGGAWLSETVWNTQEGPGNYISSGGVSSGSASYNIPAWQQGVNMSTNKGSTTKRNCPDVAMVADNVFIVADNGQNETTGGTSCASPLWAGFTALVNQRAVAASLPTVGFINPAIYHIGTNSGYAACFDDITVGNNTNNNVTQYLAVPGYDLCTGWGSPSGGSLIIALTQPDGFQITPGRGVVANGPVGGPFTLSTQSLSLTNTGQPAFNWSLGGTSAWLDVSGSSGTLTAGGGAATVSLALNPAASLLPASVYTASLWFTNQSSGLVQLRQFTLQVGQELVLDGGFETGDFCYWTLTGDQYVYDYNFVDFANDTDGADYSPFAGVYFAAFGQYSDLGYLSQPLPTQAGQFYLLSFWLENPSGATPNQFQVQWNTDSASTNIIFNQTNMAAFGWSNLQFVVQASTNITTLRFGFRNDSDYFALDNVSVQYQYVLSAPLQVQMTGLGTISPNYSNAVLAIGQSYSMTATPGTGFAFANWTGSLTTNGATLKFTMASNLTFTANFVDTNRPAVSITNLASGQRVSNAVFTVEGTASDNWQVSNVVCQINGGGWNSATNINNWTNWAAGVTLTPGTNLVQAFAVDTSGNVSTTNSVSFQFVVTNQLQIRASGLGTISPNYSNAWLEIGRNYSITSTPASGFVFSNWLTSTNWIGGVTTTKTNLPFMMASNLTLQVTFLDVTRPTNTITAPAAGQHMTNALATVVGTARDNWKVAGVWYQFNNGAWNLAPTTNGWTNWTTTLKLTAGTNTVKAYAMDLGGNFSTTNSLNVVSSNTFKLQLAFTNALPLNTNGLVFILQLSTGLNGHIQVSTNLTSWTTLTNFVGTNSTITFRDLAATNSNVRFYRAAIP